MHSNTLSNILNRIPSKNETFDVEFLTQKLFEWNQEIEKEFIERPKIISQQPSQENIVSLSQLSSNIQHKLLEQIQNQNPSLYCRRTQHPLSQCGWKEVTRTNDSDSNALAASMALSISSKSQCLSSSDIGVPVPNPTHILHLEWISELIRTAKNIIRYNRILLTYVKNQRHAPSWKDPFFGLDSTSVLCSQGMIQLYLSILSQNSQWNSSKNSCSTEWNVVRDDLARQSATILFHATFAHAEEPCCKKALRMLQSREMNGPGILASLLLQPNSVHVMLALMKNVHNMMSVYPVVISEMDASLQTLNMYDEGITMGVDCSLNVLTILITTLSWCVHSPDFPGSTEDRRSDLAIEIIRVLFAIRGVLGKHQVKEMEDANQEIMTRLGKLIVYILHLSNQNSRVYQCKLSVLMLLMDAPVEFSRFLRINHVIEELILIFWYELNEFVVEKAAGNATSDKNSTSMLPILLVLNTLCKNDSHIREQVKAAVFPPDAEEEFLAKAKEKGPEKNMHPLDAPLGSTRHKLIGLLTHYETNLKRCCGELLWTLCGNDSKEFIRRCGFGNAVHQLGVKGLYALPK